MTGFDSSIIDEELVQGFFTDVEESFYPQVNEAMARIRAGDVLGGIDGLMRPLHTIKGSTSFIGLDAISHFTHAVEDFLKAVQSGNRPVDAAEDAARILRAVDKVFNLLDQARAGEPLDTAGRDAVLSELKAPPQGGGISLTLHDDFLRVEECPTDCGLHPVTILRVLAPRVHLPKHYQPLVDALDALPEGVHAVLDLSVVRTLNSSTWGALQAAAKRLHLAVFGMSGSTRTTFYSWGFDAYITAYADEASYRASFAKGA